MNKKALLLLSLGLLPVSAQNLSDTSTAIYGSGVIDQATSQQGTQAKEMAANLLRGVPAPDDSAEPVASFPIDLVTSLSQEPIPFDGEQENELNDALNALANDSLIAAQLSFEKLISENFFQPEPHFALALAHANKKEYKAARFELEQLIRLKPERYEGFFNLGILSYKENKKVMALEYLEEALNLTEEGSDARYITYQAISSIETQLGDYRALESTLDSWLADFPEDPDVSLRLALTKTLNNDGIGALRYAYVAFNNSSTRGYAGTLIADIYSSYGLNERALKEVNFALERANDNRTDSILMIRKAQLLHNLGRSKEALNMAIRAARIYKDNAAAYARVGAIRMDLGMYSGAEKAYREAARLDPRNGFYRTELGLARMNLGDYKRAKNDALLAIKSGNPAMIARANMLLGLISYNVKNYEKAFEQLQDSVAEIPSAEAYYWLGMTAYKLADFSSSAEAFKRSLELKPTVKTRKDLGNALVAAGNSGEAVEVLKEVVKEIKGSGEAWYLLGLAQRQSGNEDAAKYAFRKSHKLGYKKAWKALN